MIRELFPEDGSDTTDAPVRTVRTVRTSPPPPQTPQTPVAVIGSPTAETFQAQLWAALAAATASPPDVITLREEALAPEAPILDGLIADTPVPTDPGYVQVTTGPDAGLALETRTVAEVVQPPDPAGSELTVDQLLAGLPFAYLQGAAGTGKTWLARQVIAARDDAVLCATTGIAAVNLGDATTLNSVLAYFDTTSLLEKYASGFLQYRLRMLRKSGIRTLVVDEISMMPADQLTVLVQAFDELDQQKTYDKDLGVGYEYADGDLRMKLLLVGDFAQLPPVKAPFAFESPAWGRFAERTFKLTTVRRQGDQRFVDALQAVRKGNARSAVEVFESRMVSGVDFNFQGTTIVASNLEVDRLNGLRHSKLAGPEYSWKTVRSGEQQSDWMKQIPEQVDLKQGALVMILSNKAAPREDCQDTRVLGELLYANGELATVVDQDPHGIRVMLHRTFAEVVVTPAVKEWKEPTGKKNPRFTIKGAVSYLPLRLAYATTVHKSQGLSLDAVQVSLIHGMFHKPGMTYVALSRCRSLEGLRIVSNPKMFQGRCGVDAKIQEYL